MEESWTKGQWIIKYEDYNDSIRIDSEEYFMEICKIPMRKKGDPQAEANANLLVSAPSLYEQLRNMLRIAHEEGWDDLPDTDERKIAMLKAWKAIFQARGK